MSSLSDWLTVSVEVTEVIEVVVPGVVAVECRNNGCVFACFRIVFCGAAGIRPGSCADSVPILFLCDACGIDRLTDIELFIVGLKQLFDLFFPFVPACCPHPALSALCKCVRIR